MLAPGEAPLLGPAASGAGFEHRQRTFASTILARQLGELAGRDTVATTMFKAHLPPPGGRAVEVAIPHGVDEGTVAAWIARGIGAHVAFRVDSPARLERLKPILEQDGYRMPAFMSGAPLSNPAEGITAVFFDRRPAQPLGIEFCHYEGARSATASSAISSDISFR
jgi:hypothetical protein